MNCEITKFLDEIGFSDEQLEFIRSEYKGFKSETSTNNEYNVLCNNLFDKNFDVSVLCNDLTAFAKKSTIKEGLFYLLYFLENLDNLYDLYKKEYLDEQIFLDGIKDFKYKVDEFFQMKGYIGTDFLAWHVVFFRLIRFAFGRFQYQVENFSHSEFNFGEICVKKGDEVIAMHIPSGNKMSREDRLDSYKKAYSFFKSRKFFSDGIMKVTCHTWILFPPFKQLFNQGSNLLDFANEFIYLYTDQRETFTDGWRIFGVDYNDEYKNLPRNTSLQRAFDDFLNSENSCFGIGYSIMLFDGENIITKI